MKFGIVGRSIEVGSGKFLFSDPAIESERKINIHYYCPQRSNKSSPIVFILHGFDRAASYFRDCWIDHAERFDLIVMAPEFDVTSFPESAHYNHGNVRASEKDGGHFNPRDRWTFFILDRLFEDVRKAVGSDRTSFSLFGHSAGAQFAHRYLALSGTPRVDLVVSGNAGWYMLPDRDSTYPAGVGGLDFTDSDLRAYLAKPLVLLLGESDNNEAAAGLPTNPEAIAQGPHRLSRGRFYFRTCKGIAQRLNRDFAWRLVGAPGVGHGDREIAEPAAKLIAGRADLLDTPR